MENKYMVVEKIVELILNKVTQCSTKDEILNEIRGVQGQIKNHKFEQLDRELGLF